MCLERFKSEWFVRAALQKQWQLKYRVAISTETEIYVSVGRTSVCRAAGRTRFSAHGGAQEQKKTVRLSNKITLWENHTIETNHMLSNSMLAGAKLHERWLYISKELNGKPLNSHEQNTQHKIKLFWREEIDNIFKHNLYSELVDSLLIYEDPQLMK